jgi:hypothetical protein
MPHVEVYDEPEKSHLVAAPVGLVGMNDREISQLRNEIDRVPAVEREFHSSTTCIAYSRATVATGRPLLFAAASSLRFSASVKWMTTLTDCFSVRDFFGRAMMFFMVHKTSAMC